MGDQVMKKMVSPWKYGGMSPEGSKYIVQLGTLVVMCERESQVHLGIQHDTCGHVLQYEISELCIDRYGGCEEHQQ